ncbi:MAG TPA: LysE family transporter [Methanomassiliicoccaceae archaeon]|nr:LysE family transporter [Methanomassiliicoccaceae archaeon]
MEGPTDPLMFLGWVVLISASGVIAPGPLFATAVARGIDDPRAGLKISLGHAIVEMPLILTIFLGLMAFLQDENILAGIGLVGGAFLFYTGVSMLRPKPEDIEGDTRHGSLMSGIVLTAANPYFLMWWATAGAALIGLAAGFGWWMMLIFIVVHLSCDFAYLGLVSYSVSKGRSLLQGRWLRVIYVACGICLILFAMYFLYGSLDTFLTLR